MVKKMLPLRHLNALCASLVSFFAKQITAKTRRSQRKRREQGLRSLLLAVLPSTPVALRQIILPQHPCRD
jgi:hypothetical protein